MTQTLVQPSLPSRRTTRMNRAIGAINNLSETEFAEAAATSIHGGLPADARTDAEAFCDFVRGSVHFDHLRDELIGEAIENGEVIPAREAEQAGRDLDHLVELIVAGDTGGAIDLLRRIFPDESIRSPAQAEFLLDARNGSFL